jgi:hypothetical protein
MSMGNVTASKINDQYYQQAMIYLREASQTDSYSLPTHLEQWVKCCFTTSSWADIRRYLNEYGPLYPAA